MRSGPRIPPWIHRALDHVTGLTISPSTDDTLLIAISGGRQHTFEVLNMPTLSQEKAAEFVRNRQKISTQKQRHLNCRSETERVARQLLAQRRNLWVEEETGVCFLAGPGLLIDTKIRDGAERQASGSGQAKLRGRSGLVVESVLSFFST